MPPTKRGAAKRTAAGHVEINITELRKFYESVKE